MSSPPPPPSPPPITVVRRDSADSQEVNHSDTGSEWDDGPSEREKGSGKDAVPALLRRESPKGTRQSLGLAEKVFKTTALPPKGSFPPVSHVTPAHKEILDSSRDLSQSKIAIEAVWVPSLNRDTTVHLELDIEEDLETQLEEFSRLKRLGHFKAAEHYFQTNLHDYIDIPLVTVEYADMLFQQGAYKHLIHLLSTGELSSPRLPLRSNPLLNEQQRPSEGPNNPYRANIDIEKLNLNFELVTSSSYMYSQGWLVEALEDVRNSISKLYGHTPKRRRDILRSSSQFGSTEVQIVSYCLNIVAYARFESNFAEDDEFSNIVPDWPELYQSILARGQIWEVRDIMLSSFFAFGVERTWQNLFNVDIHATDISDSFFADWSVEEYDESTYLAILDILVIMARHLINIGSHALSKAATLTTIKRYLEHARAFALCIKQNNPENIKSRPYIMWILTQETFARWSTYLKNKPTFDFLYLDKSPGLTLSARLIFPIYIPDMTENPGWPAPYLPERSNDLLETALQASRELGDYRVEISCLVELIGRLKDPKDKIAELTHLQKVVQGDMDGYLKTCLSKYLLTSDDKSRQALLNEFAEINSHRPIVYDIRNPVTEWSQRMVQSALYHSLENFPTEAMNAQYMASVVAVNLPSSIHNVMCKLRLWRMSNFPARYIDRRSAYRNLALNAPNAIDPSQQDRTILGMVRGELDKYKLEHDRKIERELDRMRMADQRKGRKGRKPKSVAIDIEGGREINQDGREMEKERERGGQYHEQPKSPVDRANLNLGRSLTSDEDVPDPEDPSIDEELRSIIDDDKDRKSEQQDENHILTENHEISKSNQEEITNSGSRDLIVPEEGTNSQSEKSDVDNEKSKRSSTFPTSESVADSEGG
ncbi:hypothetical protein B7463_g893, partial [Scytalidium lignicola]